MSAPVKLFSLSTCSHCKATKKFLTDNGVPYDYTDVDLLSGKERQQILDEVVKYNPSRTFPTILIGDKVVIGFDEKAIREALGL
ncbi:MAG TPA: glutaredoxin family protein [Syntrophales bacterium]|nr:glutaredoxin family protein [Syntrophobacterales bacterium]HRR41923.1 glutaredoxin family protein [Syntrophales bacterium]HRT27053.1 glutaredoxin family protein [Syntrophales bacterium]HRT70916.1 glutaredoxin family protein [Syntrophales bacterium]